MENNLVILLVIEFNLLCDSASTSAYINTNKILNTETKTKTHSNRTRIHAAVYLASQTALAALT